MARKKLGEILVERGIIDQRQLQDALGYGRAQGVRLGVALVTRGHLGEGMLAKVLGEVMGLPAVDLSTAQFEHEALRLVPLETCKDNDLIPIFIDEKRGSRALVLAMADPMNVAVIDEIEFTTGLKVRPVMATLSAIHSAIRKFLLGMNTVIVPPSMVPQQVRQGIMTIVRPGGKMEEVDTSLPADRQGASRPPQPAKAKLDSAGSGQRPPPQQPPATPGTDPRAPGSGSQPKPVAPASQLPRPSSGGSAPKQFTPAEEALSDYLREVQSADPETVQKLEKLEKYFWALVRSMARKGLISKEEFLKEMKD
ncbi:MAG: hypothetical protein HY897_18100 [Deltaproteobacteria bacterium]|nr:hypothetical protein [Deltaproteobacteria bacterium]